MLTKQMFTYLSENKFFKNIDNESIKQLDNKLFCMKEYRAGDLIVQESSFADEMFLIISGTVKIVKKLHNGEESEISRRTKNEYVGELSLIQDKKRSASIYCVSDVKVIVIKKDAFFVLLEIFPLMGRNIAKTIANRLRESDTKTVAEIGKYETLFTLHQEIYMQKQELERLNNELEKKNDELYKTSITDELTSICNRGFTMTVLEKEFTRAIRHKTNLSCILIDLDKFKVVNDTFGHLVGDFVLKKTAQLMSSQIRNEDILGRYGGEEFLVVLPQTDVENARIVAEKIRKKIESSEYSINDWVINITISLGISDIILYNVKNIDNIIYNADIALYKAKKNGRNQTILFSEDFVTRK